MIRQSKIESALTRSIEEDEFLQERLERQVGIPAVRPMTVQTWALEVGEVQGLSLIKKAVRCCGWCGTEKSSGSMVEPTLLLKQPNKPAALMAKTYESIGLSSVPV